MIFLYAFVSAGMMACAFFMILSRNLVRMLLGLALLSTGVNVLLFVTGGLSNRQPPIIRDGEQTLASAADPLAQALILTAIVIGFALTVVLATLVLRAWRSARSLDSRDIDAAEKLGAARRRSKPDE